MAKGEFTEKTRSMIRERANNRCELCGTSIPYGGQIHHRQPRGMGGTKIKGKESCANGIYIHLTCHSKVESQRAEAYSKGWLVKSGFDPAEQPVRLWDGWYLLASDGQRQPCSPVE